MAASDQRLDLFSPTSISNSVISVSLAKPAEGGQAGGEFLFFVVSFFVFS